MGPILVLLAGVGAKAATASAAQVTGMERVLYSEQAAVSHGMAEGLAALLQGLQAKCSAWGGGWGSAQAPAARSPHPPWFILPLGLWRHAYGGGGRMGAIPRA